MPILDDYVEVNNQVFSLDYLINLPVLKGHCQTKLTCALKNMKGVLSNRDKKRFHTLGLHKPIALLNAAVKQDFIMVDSICGDLDFEEGGTPVTTNQMYAAIDPVLCDEYMAKQIGYNPQEIAYIQMARQYGVGENHPNEPEIIALNTSHWAGKPCNHTGRVEQLGQYIQEKEACSACYAALVRALDQLKEPFGPKIRQGIGVGQGWRGEKGTLGSGNCTSKFHQFIPGCPPTAKDILDHLIEINKD